MSYTEIEVREGDVSDSDDLDKQSRKDIDHGLIIDVVVQLTLCVIASASFSDSQGVWIVFGTFFVVRALCYFVDWYLKGESPLALQALMVSTILPYLFYMVILNYSFLYDCDPDVDVTEIKTFFGKKTSNVTETEIHCHRAQKYVKKLPRVFGKAEVEIEIAEIVPFIIQFAVPFLFAQLILSMAKLFESDFSKTKTIFQLAILDYLDIADFGTMPFTYRGWFFFEQNPIWFIAFLVFVSIAYLAAIAEVADALRSSSTRLFLYFSLIGIDLPFFMLRTYFFYCRVEISCLFLGKNMLSALYEFATIYGCPRVTSGVASLVAMVPGADAVDSHEQQLRAKKEKAKLKHSNSLLKSNLEKKKNEEEAAEEAKKRKKILTERMMQIEYLVEVTNQATVTPIGCIDCVTGETSTYEHTEAKVREAFRSLDVDSDGKLSETEINDRAFALAGEEDAALRFLNFLNDRDLSGVLSIDTAAKYFMLWRCEEDMALDGDDDSSSSSSSDSS